MILSSIILIYVTTYVLRHLKEIYVSYQLTNEMIYL